MASNGNNAVVELTSAGAVATGSPFTATTPMAGPYGIAVDGSGYVWVTSDNATTPTGSSTTPSTVTRLTSAGTEVAGSPYTPGGYATQSIAFDAQGNAWLGGLTSDLFELSSSGALLAQPSNPGGYLDQPFAVAITAAGAVWTGSEANGSVQLTSNTQSTGTNTTGGGLAGMFSLAVDGASTAWIADQSTNAVAAVNTSGTPLSPSAGFQAAGMNSMYGVAVDASGNVWTANTGSNTVTELVGIAVPVVTPLVTAVVNKTIGTRP